jgi:hypothetical protein
LAPKFLFVPVFQGFYLYLYLGSLLFLCYMYAGVMKEEVVLSVSRKTSAFEMSNSEFFQPDFRNYYMKKSN